MDQQLLQRTRYLLQIRFRKLKMASLGKFELVAEQVLHWLEEHPVIGAVVQYLDQVPGPHKLEIKLIMGSKVNGTRYFHLTVKHGPRNDGEPEFQGYTPVTLEQEASSNLQVLRAIVQHPDEDQYDVLATYLTQEETRFRQHEESLEVIKNHALTELYEYIDEHLDGVNSVNGLLRKYKQGAEWFQREYLRQVLDQGLAGNLGERALALHLQQYIFDQGVEFVIEPSSRSGEADILLRDTSGGYAIIDAKLIKSGDSLSDITRRIASGFNQVARYCNDYNQAEGFLTVFIDSDISILIDIEQDRMFRYFRVGGHVIYYIEINIADRASASKSGKAKQVHITNDMLTAQINASNSE